MLMIQMSTQARELARLVRRVACVVTGGVSWLESSGLEAQLTGGSPTYRQKCLVGIWTMLASFRTSSGGRCCRQFLRRACRRRRAC